MTSEIEDATAFLAELVQARSPNPPGDETLVAKAIIRKAAALGLPKFTCHAKDPRRPNIMMNLGHGSPTLLLAAHMDTMPPGNLPSWHSDPYCLTHADGRLGGLGSADMKAAVAAMIFAAARIAKSPENQGTLTLVFSSDEENGSSYGMEWLAQQGLLVADGAAMTEPSGLGQKSWQRLFVAQRGHCVSWLVARGVPGHSGEPVSRDQRASYAFVKALNALLEADPFAEWMHSVDGTRPTVNVATMVEGGMVPFAHPESLRACLEVRVIEGMTEDLVIGRLRDVIVKAGLSDRVTIEPAAPPLNWISPGEQVRDKRLLDAAKFAWRKVLGREPILAVMTAGTDSSHANAAGIPALPAFGPGSLGVAHKPNEALPEEDLGLAIDLFESFIRAYHRETQYV